MLNENLSSIEKALFILQKTNDGNALCPLHLKLVELAINGLLADDGKAAFEKLYQNVQAGYKQPWFHDIEHLTIDYRGYIYWKDQQIEHFNLSWAFSEEAKKAAQELANRCKTLEARGKPINTSTVVWQWKE